MSVGRKPKVKSSVMINEEVWKEIRILAIRENKEIGELVEEIFRERLERRQQTGLLIPEKSELRQFMSRVADSLKKREMFELSEEDFTRYLERNKRIQIQEQKTEETELRELIKQLAKDLKKTESEMEEFNKMAAQKYGMSELDYARYLKLDAIFNSKKREIETEELR